MYNVIILAATLLAILIISSEKASKFFHDGLDLSAKSFGFHGFDSMMSYIFVLSNKMYTTVVLAISWTVGVLTWMESWVFSPFYTYMVFICLMASEAILGTIKAIYKDKEKFNWDKFMRIVPKFLAHTFALSAAFHMSKAEPLFAWMPSAVFIFFATQNFMKSILHLVDLNVLEGNFANFMREKFSQNNDLTKQQYEDKPSGD